MKKVASIIGLAALIATINTSCKKNWTCECCATSGGSTVCTSGTTEKMKKKDAEAKCNEGDVTSGSVTQDCKIKYLKGLLPLFFVLEGFPSIHIRLYFCLKNS
ncbi:MAG: hypothetical protein KatS3mg027_1376 [Bacteroidia bacterium]|nr:MAG: hypothetical protein KatS3mg027_1376 [Bacteroidia bacterium]